MADLTYKSDANVKTGQLILKIAGVPVAYATSASLTLSTNVIDTSNKMDGSWQSGVAGKKSYTVSSEQLLTEQKDSKSYHSLLKAQIEGKPVAFEFGTMTYNEDPSDGSLSGVAIDTSCPSYSGNIIINSFELQSEANDLAKSTLQAQGSGPLVVTEPTA